MEQVLRMGADGSPGDGGAGEEGLLLRELSHRTLNEYAVAIAALRVAASGRVDPTAGVAMLDEAARRLEASAELHRLLARPACGMADAGGWVRDACTALCASRAGPGGPAVRFDIGEVAMDGGSARRLAMVAAELVTNALKHAGGADLSVSLRRIAGGVSLRVADGGPGIRPGAASSGGGLGSGIVAELVRAAGGRIVTGSGAEGTAINVELPVIGSLPPGRACGR